MAKSTNTNTNSKTKKSTTPTEDTLIYSTTTTNTKKKPTTVKAASTQKTTPVPVTINKTGSGSNQAGKKRGQYTNNLWFVESSEDGKKWVVEQEFFESRDEARDAVIDRFRGQYPDERFRVAKYVFNNIDRS
jgi:hypothetical protein